MTKDMTSGSPARLILRFTIPLIFGNLFQQFYSMVDTIIVGRFLGKESLAAVGSLVLLISLSSASALDCAAALPFRFPSSSAQKTLRK